MDTSNSPDISIDCSCKEELTCIKKCLVDLAANVTEMKDHMKQQTEIVLKKAKYDSGLAVQISTRQEFDKFDDEISKEREKFDNFVEILNKLYVCSESSIKSNLSMFFKTVLNAIFSKDLFKTISWAKYGDKISIKSSTIVDAIQRSGSFVDNMTTEYNRLKILQKEFSKCKDAKRVRSSKRTAIATEASKFPIILFNHSMIGLTTIFFVFPGINSDTIENQMAIGATDIVNAEVIFDQTDTDLYETFDTDMNDVDATITMTTNAIDITNKSGEIEAQGRYQQSFCFYAVGVFLFIFFDLSVIIEIQDALANGVSSSSLIGNEQGAEFLSLNTCQIIQAESLGKDSEKNKCSQICKK